MHTNKQAVTARYLQHAFEVLVKLVEVRGKLFLCFLFIQHHRVHHELVVLLHQGSCIQHIFALTDQLKTKSILFIQHHRVHHELVMLLQSP